MSQAERTQAHYQVRFQDMLGTPSVVEVHHRPEKKKGLEKIKHNIHLIRRKVNRRKQSKRKEKK